MPNTKKQSKRGKQRNMKVSSPPALIMPVLKTTMLYSQYYGCTESASGVGAYYSFRLNDLYDPDLTGTGQQPVAFDQLSALYTRFRVLSTDVEVQFCTRGAGGARVGMFPSSQTTLPANAESWVCQPYSKHSYVSGNTAGPAATRVRRRFNISDVLGLTGREYLSDLDFTGTPSNSPIRCAYLHVWCHNKSGVPAAIDGFVTLMFHVEWSQPYLNSVS